MITTTWGGRLIMVISGCEFRPQQCLFTSRLISHKKATIARLE